MAKGNLFQGMGRGKIGDVVFSRLNGQQVSRVRNRNPKNPRSNAQLYQRAIMATIMQAYSAGKQIFDHSFQGVSVGAGCQAVFMRQNLKSLRTQLSHEINDGVLADDLTVHCVYPGSTSPVPNAYLISTGTYDQKAFTAEVNSSGVAFTLPAPENNETVAAFCARVGLIPDDYYTFCFFLSGEDVLYEAPTANDDSLGQVFDCQFGFARLHVRSNVKSNENPVADWIDVFEIDETANCAPTFIYGSITFGITLEALDYQQNGAGALGCIRSRKDKDLRSTSYMFCPSSGEVGINEFGLCAKYVLESWKAGTQSLGNSDLILEGGGGAKPAPSIVQISGWIDASSDEYFTGKDIGVIIDNGEEKIPVSIYKEGDYFIGVQPICRKHGEEVPFVWNEFDNANTALMTEEALVNYLENTFGKSLYITYEGTDLTAANKAIENVIPQSLLENAVYSLRNYLVVIDNGVPKVVQWPNGSVDKPSIIRNMNQWTGDANYTGSYSSVSGLVENVTDSLNFQVVKGTRTYTFTDGVASSTIYSWFD